MASCSKRWSAVYRISGVWRPQTKGGAAVCLCEPPYLGMRHPERPRFHQRAELAWSASAPVLQTAPPPNSAFEYSSRYSLPSVSRLLVLRETPCPVHETAIWKL